MCEKHFTTLFICTSIGNLAVPSAPLVSEGCNRFRSNGVCDLVLSYRNEPLPVNVHDELWNLIDKTRLNLKIELATDPSYATAARCLDKLIQDHRAADRRREERHRES